MLFSQTRKAASSACSSARKARITKALADRGYDAKQVDAKIAADKAREQFLQLNFAGTPCSSAVAAI